MTQICRQCARPNPEGAWYCYHDGTALGDHVEADGSNGRAARPFHNPFVLPSGQVCRTFDELALTCQRDWPLALRLLRENDLQVFLASMGRADLALAAREAACYPDPDRGLDQFLARLPSQALAPPRLHAEPTAVNLGVLAVGQDRRLELRLVNRGMRLLYGSLTCADSPWLTVGDGPGAHERLFQFQNDLVVPVHVRGKQLRASHQPLEGRLTIDSNGGSASVVVRLDVPVKPFPTGALAGASSPREVADRARLAPREATQQFESGAVAAWYADNGWTYPVPGEVASGLAAVQQFFEALGLAKPPTVQLGESAVCLEGAAGDRLEHVLTVQAQEQRPVYAHAHSDQPWLHVGRGRLEGTIAHLPLAIPVVPDRPGEILQAQVSVTANGNQRFLVPVTLVVRRVQVARVPKPRAGARVTPTQPGRPRAWRRLAPAGLLLLLLAALVGRDFFLARSRGDREPPILPEPEAVVEVAPVDPEPRIEVHFSRNRQFGVVMLAEKDQDAGFKKLTYSTDGGTNDTCLLVDGDARKFGERPGHWVGDDTPLGSDADGRVRVGQQSVWRYPNERIVVTQTVEVVPGEQAVEVVPGQPRRLLNTCLVHYRLDNQDQRPHRVGLRFLLDTFIGANDGVPFMLPGEPALCTTYRQFRTPAEVPDFLQALEFPDLRAPGTIAHLTLKLGGEWESPSALLLTHWKNHPGWRVPQEDIGGDSAVAIYWDEQELAPGQKRTFGFAYGLGDVATADSGGKLGVTLGRGSFQPGETFQVTSYVSNPLLNETVTLVLPEGFQLVDSLATQPVPLPPPGEGSHNIPITWKVQAGEREGNFKLKVQSSAGAAQAKPIVVIKPTTRPRTSTDPGIFR